MARSLHAPADSSHSRHSSSLACSYSNPRLPDWARGRVSEEPPASGTWIVDARDFTDEKLPLAKVGAGAPVHCMA